MTPSLCNHCGALGQLNRCDYCGTRLAAKRVRGKLEMADEMLRVGVMTIDEARAMLGFGNVADSNMPDLTQRAREVSGE